MNENGQPFNMEVYVFNPLLGFPVGLGGRKNFGWAIFRKNLAHLIGDRLIPLIAPLSLISGILH